LRHYFTSIALDAPTREEFLNTLAEVGDANDLATLLDSATFARTGTYDAAMQARVLGALEKASRVRSLRPAGDVGGALLKLWQDSADRGARLGALRLATLWRVKQLEPAALEAAFRTPTDDELRSAGATALAAIGGTNAMKKLEELAGPTRSAGERVAAAVGFSSVDLKRAAEIAADVLAKDTEGGSVPQLLPTSLNRKRGASLLAEAMQKQSPSRNSARAALRFMGSVGREDKELLARFNAAAGLSGEPLKATPEFVRQLVAEVRERGDAARGREVFRRTDLNCLACHTVGADGGTTGPDLNAIGAGQPLEFIIGAVLEPNREVKENFESIEVTMKDGESYTGYRVRSDSTELAMRDVARNQVVRLRRDQIASQVERGSVMPSGLVDHLTRGELRDLFQYLSELGKAK